jgi:GalNAc-alpha-(1->4)-GalNAc-alpha-(1->3)-diNAcBac-PP-undecaprenol alpha-1,4-N-acetyl-D-galactosaminyltransferase
MLPSLKAGGAERVVSTIANQLIEEYEITIIVFYECTPFYPLDTRINIVFCKKVYRAESSSIQSIKTHIQLFKKSLQILKRENTRLVIGFMTTANIYAVIAAKRLKIKSIISERIHPEYEIISKLWLVLKKFFYPKSNKLIVQTKVIKSYFENFVTNNQLEIIKNPLAPELIIKRDLSKTKEQLILNVGRLDDQKNQDLLIKAFANIPNKNWKLILIGEGTNRIRYTNLIKELHLQEQIILKGNITNVEDYYNTASLFVFTSRYEGYPNALTEAMYFGVSCISTDCPSGPAELISNAENGFLIPVGDQDLLEKKMKLLMSDEDLRTKFSANSLKSTVGFEADHIALQWKSIINNVLK